MADIDKEKLSLMMQGATSVREVLGLAVGGGSVCWEHVDKAGVFQSEDARLIVEGAAGAIERLLTPVIQAWTNPGPSPSYHEMQKQRLRREWPVLAQALDSLGT